MTIENQPCEHTHLNPDGLCAHCRLPLKDIVGGSANSWDGTVLLTKAVEALRLELEHAEKRAEDYRAEREAARDMADVERKRADWTEALLKAEFNHRLSAEAERDVERDRADRAEARASEYTKSRADAAEANLVSVRAERDAAILRAEEHLCPACIQDKTKAEAERDAATQRGDMLQESLRKQSAYLHEFEGQFVAVTQRADARELELTIERTALQMAQTGLKETEAERDAANARVKELEAMDEIWLDASERASRATAKQSGESMYEAVERVVAERDGAVQRAEELKREIERRDELLAGAEADRDAAEMLVAKLQEDILSAVKQLSEVSYKLGFAEGQGKFLEHLLRNLMARIHCDGGHRQDTFPTLAEAAEDCDKIVVDLFRRVEEGHDRALDKAIRWLEEYTHVGPDGVDLVAAVRALKKSP